MSVRISFFTAHPEQLDALRAEAMRWLGTPFRANSAACGVRGGVDCVRLAAAIEEAAGAVPAVNYPRYAIDAGSHLAESPLLEYLSGRGAQPDSGIVAAHLEALSPEETTVQAGDVLALKFARTPYHLAVVLTDEGDLVHVLARREVERATLRDGRFADALKLIFRPVAREVQS